MELRLTDPELDRDPTTIHPPINEVFASPADALQRFPELFANEATMTALEHRRSQVEHITTALDQLGHPPVEVEEALATGAISKQAADHMWQSLADMFAEPENARLTLYLPFEVMPSQAALDQGLSDDASRFQTSYLNAWARMLNVHDVRANFVDGDVIELDKRNSDPERVVKAAHLIPELLQKGWLEMDQIEELREATMDEVLNESIADALTATDLQPEISSESIYDLLQRPREPSPPDTTPRREEWLQAAHEETLVAGAATIVARELGDAEDRVHQASLLLEGAQTDLEQRATIKGLTLALPSVLSHKEARLILARLPEPSSAMASNMATDEHATLLRHCHALGVITEEELNNFGLITTQLTGNTSRNLEVLDADTAKARRIAHFIETDSRASISLVPVVLMGGSRLKGYGEQHSDVDLSLFVRPNQDPLVVEELISELADSTNVDDDMILYWLGGSDGTNEVVEPPNTGAHSADRYWSHCVFNDAWVGSSDEVVKLQSMLLMSYAKNHTLAERADRDFYLQAIERDLLQYRLLHKGYERHYPTTKKTAESIDGNSAYWDSGYRAVATKLFIDKVYIPQLNS